MISATVLSLLFAAGSCAAGVVPTAPGPGQSFKEGGDCTFTWKLDTTDKWTSFSVDLMSGSNTAMQAVTNVFKDRDGTKGETSHTFKCPAVTPHSAIYFYQFTQAGADTTWTTRFAITSPSGDVTPPANSAQPDGAQIPWGIGHLAGAGAEAAPANTATTAPSPTANITALNTPAASGNTTNSTAGTAAATNTTAATTTPGTTPVAPTQSTTPATGSNGKTSSSTVSPPKTGTNPPNPSESDASALSLHKHVVAAFALAAAVAVAC